MKETLYKLTNQNQETQGGTKWDAGVEHSHEKRDYPRLCSGDVFHAYRNANLAFLLNPNHADIENPILWECEGEVAVSDWGNVGCFSLKITKRLPAPAWVNSGNETRVRVMFAILCAEAVLDVYENKYQQDDRPRRAIEAAREYIKNPSAHAAHAAHAAAYAAYAAYAAAHAAAHAADAAAYAAAYAADAAAHAAHAADAAADAAAHAAAYAAAHAADLDFGALADKAVRMIGKTK